MPRFHLINAEELKKQSANPVKKILERDESNEFGEEQMRRAHALLRTMHPAVYDIMQKNVVDEIIHSSSSSSQKNNTKSKNSSSSSSKKSEDFIVRLNDDSPMPKASVILFAALLDCVADSQTSLRAHTLDRRLPLVTFIHEVIASVYEIRSSYADSLKSTACLLRMLSNFSLLTSWAFFQKSAKTVAKMPADSFTASLSRTTIMGLRRTSAIETVEPSFSAASTRTNVLHSNINDAFAAMSMMESSRHYNDEDVLENTAKKAIEKRLASYFNEPISVPVFEDSAASSPVKGHVQLTRWFLTLANLAEESEEALIAALLQEIDFVSERLIEHFVDGYEADLGTSIAGTANTNKSRTRRPSSANGGADKYNSSNNDQDDDDDEHHTLTALSPSRRRIGYSDHQQAKEVLGLVHPLTNDFAKIVESITEITNLLRPAPPLPSSDDNDNNQDEQYYNNKSSNNNNNNTINWSHNLAVHRLTCGVVSLFLERVSAAIVDSFGICLQHCESLKDEHLLMRNDLDGCYVKQCLSLLERTLSEDLGLDDSCLEALLPLRELCDLLALPPDCFEAEGIFFSATPKALVQAFIFEQIGQDIPSLAPRSSNQCSLLDLVTCGDLLHGCPDDGLKVESDSELTALRWDLEEFSPEEVSASKYRRESESKRIASAKTFAEIFKGVSASLLNDDDENENDNTNTNNNTDAVTTFNSHDNGTVVDDNVVTSTGQHQEPGVPDEAATREGSESEDRDYNNNNNNKPSAVDTTRQYAIDDDDEDDEDHRRNPYQDDDREEDEKRTNDTSDDYDGEF